MRTNAQVAAIAASNLGSDAERYDSEAFWQRAEDVLWWLDTRDLDTERRLAGTRKDYENDLNG